MSELNKDIQELERELERIDLSKDKLLRERKGRNISREEYEFHKELKKDDQVTKIYRKRTNKKLKQAKKEVSKNKEEKAYKNERRPAIWLGIIIIAVIAGLIAGNFGNITGFATFTQEKTFVLNINQTFEQDSTLELNLTNATSLRINGQILGRGTVKVFLEINGTLYEVLNEDTLITESDNLITGMVTGGEDLLGLGNTTNTTEQTEVNQSLNETTNTTNTTEEVLVNKTIVLNESVEENTSEEITLNQTINTTSEIVDNITEDTTNITTNISENLTDNLSENITSNITTNISENISTNITSNQTTNLSMNISENITSNISENITTNITGNITTNISQNISKNISENITTNATTNISENITTNITQNISENKTENISQNITTNITSNITTNITQNATLNQTRPIFEFEDECIDTCILEIPEGRLIIEVRNTSLKLESITYTKRVENKPPVQKKLIQNKTFYNKYELNASEYFEDPDGEDLVFDIKSMEVVDTKIEGDLIIFETNKTGKYETFVYATDGTSLVKSNTFTLTVGTETVENVTQNATVEVEENVTQGRAVVGQPVRWTKIVKVKEPLNETTIKLPRQATNVSVRIRTNNNNNVPEEKLSVIENKTRKKLEQYQVEKELEKLKKGKKKDENVEKKIELLEQRRMGLITGQVYASEEQPSFITRTIRGFASGTGLTSITGRLTQETPQAELVNNTESNQTNTTNIETEINETTEQEIVENVTVEETNISMNASEEENITLNETQTINISEENINTSENISENITANTSENLTDNVSINISENTTANITENLSTDISENITINISENITSNQTTNISTNTTTNLTENISINLSENITTNITQNISENITENLTTNLTQNISENKTENISENITTNITSNITTNISENITQNITTNITQNITNQTSISKPAQNITPINESEEVYLVIENNATEYEVEYITEGPQQREENISKYKKRVTVSSDIHYKEVLTHTDLPSPAQKEKIQLYWLKNGSREKFDNITYIDSDDDGLVERIEWVVPHLSNQTFEISITVLNVQSYPMVGGYWTVQLNTSGTADLEITPYDLTTFLQEPIPANIDGADLEFEDFKCGDQEITDLWLGTSETCVNNSFSLDSSVYCYVENNLTYVNYTQLLETNLSVNTTSFKIPNYDCENISFWRDTVRTPGAHHILFEFGADNATAHNWAVKNATSTTMNASVSIRRPGGAMTSIQGAYMYLDSTEANTQEWHNTTWKYDYTKDCQEEGDYEVYVELLSLGNSRSETDTSGIDEAITYWVDSCTIKAVGHTNCTVHAKSKNVNSEKIFGGRLEVGDNCNITSVAGDGDDYWTADGQNTCSGADCGKYLEFYHTVSSSDTTDETTFRIMCDDGADDNTVMMLDINETCGPSTCGEATVALGGFDACDDAECTDGYTYMGNDTIESLGGFDLMNYEIGILDTWGWGTVSTYNIAYDTDQSDCDCYVGATSCAGGSCYNITGNVIGFTDSGANYNANCCGDDSSEYYNKTSYQGLESAPSITAGCCIDSDSCVYDSTCYANGTSISSIDTDSDTDFCLESVWQDCGTDSNCQTGYSCNATYDCEDDILPNVTYVDPTPGDDERTIDNSITINVTVTDSGNDIDSCWIEWDNEATTNNYSMTKSGSGASVTCYKTFATSDGVNYTYKVFANDTAKNVGSESYQNNVENTKPPAPVHLTPLNDSRLLGNTQTINWTSGGADAEGDSVTYHWFIDTSNPPSSPYTCSGSTAGTTSDPCSTSDGVTYYWNVMADDGYENQTATASWEFRENAKPSTSGVTLSSDSGNNYTTDNLTVTFSSSDSENDAITNITDWRKDGTSIAVLNMPFDTNITSTAADAVKDYSTYGNDGRINQSTSSTSPVWTDTGIIGGAYELDGQGNYIDMGDWSGKTISTLSGEVTMETWFKWTDGPDNYEYIISSGGQTGSRGIACRLDSAGSLDCWGKDGTKSYTLAGIRTINTDTWYHLSITYDTNSLKVYVNGEENTSSTGSAQANTDTQTALHLGKPNNNEDYNFEGTLDEVKIYSHTLSSEQIQENYNAGLSGHHNNKLVANETTKGETWTVAVTPNDGYEDGSTLTSNSLTVQDSSPTITLTEPDNDTTITQSDNRTPTFKWSASDPDGDDLNFTIWVSEDSGFSSINYTNTTNDTVHTITSDLGVDKGYWWKVMADDGTNQVNSSVFNFSIESYQAITLTTSSVNFGSLERNTSHDTDTEASPLVVENIGNVYTNLTIRANSTLWTDQPLGTSYYQYKADTQEASSFNEGISTTSWMNITAGFQSLLKELDFHSSSDNAQVDFNVTVPYKEPPGSKSSEVIIATE